MFRLPNRQTFKALYSPLLRTPLRSPLHYHFRLTSTRAIQVPFSGPPTYDTVARRFSSYPNPLAFYAQKRQEDARDRGEFVDIHDIGGIDPKDFDVLITDIDEEKLRSEIAEVMGIQFLAKATEEDANTVVEIGHGYIFGRNVRTIFPCVVSHDGKAHWVFFIVDSGAPLTYLSVQTSELFGIMEDQPTPVKLAGYRHSVYMSPKNSHFANVNILGMDFCNVNEVRPWHDYKNRKVTLYFGGGWEPQLSTRK